MSLDILVIDDEVDIRDLISDILRDEGFNTRAVANSSQALSAITEKTPSIIILDIWLQGSDLDGLSILEIVKKSYPLLPVIIISGHGTIETAVSAIKMGAYDYLEKPFTEDKLIIMVKRAYEATKLKRENLELKSKVIDKTEFIGSSSQIVRLKSDIEKIAPTSSRVMIHGGIGDGKELVARLIHKKSKKSNGPFVVFNPSSIPTENIHQEFFKEHNEGISYKSKSVLELANNGTLYIDEVSDLPISTQTKLLKFLRDQILEIPSSDKLLKLDVRFITSTTKNLHHEIEKGRLRQDLYYRLNVIPIKIPSLSERKEDIPMLVKYFVKQLSKIFNVKEREFSSDTIAALQAYNWPGNIRQLRNVIEWTLIMNPITTGSIDFVKPHMIPQEILNNNMSNKLQSDIDIMSMPLREAREMFERQYLLAQMNRFNNNISKTSSFVGMERSALHRKLKLLNLSPSANNKSKTYKL